MKKLIGIALLSLWGAAAAASPAAIVVLAGLTENLEEQSIIDAALHPDMESCMTALSNGTIEAAATGIEVIMEPTVDDGEALAKFYDEANGIYYTVACVKADEDEGA